MVNGSKIDTYAVKEKEKYEKMWDLNSYRERSPGERFFERGYIALSPVKGATLCDWGIGTGRAAKLFSDKGLQVEGIDIAKNAVREFKGRVWIGTMWDPPFPKHKSFDYGYCTDVMEHIPTEKVLQTLQKIKLCTQRSCWFSIATFVDHEGDAIGETLHLTLKPAEWWVTVFAKVFPRFDFTNEKKRFYIKTWSRIV